MGSLGTYLKTLNFRAVTDRLWGESENADRHITYHGWDTTAVQLRDSQVVGTHN